MTITKIPVYPELLKYESPMVIEGITYIFGFRYSVRADRWYLDIYDSERNGLQLGVKIVANWPLLRDVGDDMPSGQLLCIRKDDSDRDPNRYELGEQAVLLYFSEDEIPVREVPGADLIVEVV